MDDESRDTVRLEVHGQPGSVGRHLGVARIIRNASDLASVEHGEVLIVGAAVPCLGSVLGIAGAVVTERGGVLSNLATLARERGVPCVVGTAGLTVAVRNGDLLLVDGEVGIVSILIAAAAP